MKRSFVTGATVAACLALGSVLPAQTTSSAQSGTTPAATQGGVPNPAQAANGQMVLTGCVERSADGQFALSNAQVDTTAASAASAGSGAGATTTAATANTTGDPRATTGASTTSADATAGTAGSAITPSAVATGTTGDVSSSRWVLQGGSNLEAHVGHKVQVTGRTDTAESTRSPAATAGTTAPERADTSAAKGQILSVQSVRMVAASCP